jgi:transcription initiation factor TFIIIB Brf1 subunit/transcription initiation factor TFIIB
MARSGVEEVKNIELHEEHDKCPECESTHVVRDYQRGEIYCESCGLVLMDDIILEEEEWRVTLQSRR